MTKVSVYIDDTVWASFKAQVFQKQGNLRKLSSEIEKLIGAAVVETQVAKEFQKLGVTAKGTISSQEIKASRPKLRGPSAEQILREMRNNQIAQTLP